MKPTEKQKEIAKVIEQQAKFWQNTNDINSPTHYGDMREEIMARLEMEDLVNEKQGEELEGLLSLLYRFILRAEH